MRPTTSYRVAVTGPQHSLHALADRLVSGANALTVVDQSGVVMDYSEAFVRVREKTDDVAMLALAREIVGSDDFTLTTGYGVHQRVIK
jgi:hypothetical protein